MHGNRALLTGLFLGSLALRPQIVGIGPLLPEIQDDLGTSHAVAGLLATIPVLCMGLFAPSAPRLAHRVGTRAALALALALLGLAGLARAGAPGALLVVALTVPVGIGMGLGNALPSLVVRERLPGRPATGTGVYTTGIQIGSTVAAALAVPIAAAFGGWRAALLAFSLAACVLGVVWLALTRGTPAHVRPVAPAAGLPWRSRTGWTLVVVFSLMAMSYYGLNAWLPDAYQEHGWSEASAGALLATMNLTAIPASFVVPWLSDRGASRRPYLIAMSLVFVTGAFGLVAFPSAGYAWGLLTGVSQGGCFALVMTLPLDLEQRPERVGALVGMMLGGGYTVGATAPFVLGAVRDVTGSFDAVLWVVVGLLLLFVVAVATVPKRRATVAAPA
ncbi:MAG: MFS transporter [Thermoleophilia bacterium]|nr:MFS transporter [Thermoleophilia bacterium]MDH4346129.1 MFS transporter [Thermoleophilia bacterium]